MASKRQALTRWRQKALLGAGIATAALLGFTTCADATALHVGESMTWNGTNLPGACTDTTCSDNFTFGTGSTLIDGGAMTLTSSQVMDGRQEWDVFNITTSSGGPLAGDLNSTWEIQAAGFFETSIWNAFLMQWTANGTPFSPLTNFSGFCCATSTNPSPVTGEAYYYTRHQLFKSGPGYFYVDAIPYSAMSIGGINPNTANGFTMAIGFMPVPEPAVLGMFGFGALLIGLFVGLRRRVA